MRPKVTAIIPVRKNSVRLKNKNFLPFYKKKSLLEIKIEQLKNVKFIDKIVISSDSIKVKKIASKYKVYYHKRKKYFASSKCSGGNFFKNLADSIEGDYLVYCPCTSPIIKKKTYEIFFKKFLKYKNRYDSFNTVGRLKTFIWKDKKPLNYDLLKAPNSQDLPDNYNYLTFGINIIDRKKMIKFKNIVGKNPMFMILDKFESIDINDKIDFTVAQAIYKKNFKYC
tara:strand:- start:936 stop:1610 length:675 start_codon:yes stop_codon:yes gene_type:complete